MQFNTSISPSQMNNSQSSTSARYQQQNQPQESQVAVNTAKVTEVNAANAVNPAGQVQGSEKSEPAGTRTNEFAKGTENTRLDIFV